VLRCSLLLGQGGDEFAAERGVLFVVPIEVVGYGRIKLGCGVNALINQPRKSSILRTSPKRSSEKFAQRQSLSRYP
jgi:hypothetical protein